MPSGLSIGIDGRDLFADRLTGLGRCVLNLLEEVSTHPRGHRYIVFFNQHNALQLSHPGSAIEVVTIPESNRLFWDQIKLPRALALRGVDVFFSPYPKLPILTGVPCVNLIADVIPLTWQDYRTQRSVGKSNAAYRFWAWKAGRIVTLSEHAKGNLVRVLGLDPERIVVIPGSIPRRLLERPPEAEIIAVREAFGLPETFCLYVGSAAPHKNLVSLIEGHASLPDELRAAYPLVLAGFGGGEADRWLSGLDPEVRSSIRSLGAVSDGQLHVLYHEASLFVFPSLAEGFGFPPLEAMACGTPVIAVQTGPMPEVLGQAPYWVERGSPAQLAKAIATLLASEDQRQRLIERGHRLAERYASTEPASRLIECLESTWAEVAASRR
jgi:glycosyltransferase involved in cell wall biosynthesis